MPIKVMSHVSLEENVIDGSHFPGSLNRINLHLQLIHGEATHLRTENGHDLFPMIIIYYEFIFSTK